MTTASGARQQTPIEFTVRLGKTDDGDSFVFTDGTTASGLLGEEPIAPPYEFAGQGTEDVGTAGMDWDPAHSPKLKVEWKTEEGDGAAPDLPADDFLF